MAKGGVAAKAGVLPIAKIESNSVLKECLILRTRISSTAAGGARPYKFRAKKAFSSLNFTRRLRMSEDERDFV
jgi:hypothetical protein